MGMTSKKMISPLCLPHSANLQVLIMFEWLIIGRVTLLRSIHFFFSSPWFLQCCSSRACQAKQNESSLILHFVVSLYRFFSISGVSVESIHSIYIFFVFFFLRHLLIVSVFLCQCRTRSLSLSYTAIFVKRLFVCLYPFLVVSDF